MKITPINKHSALTHGGTPRFESVSRQRVQSGVAYAPSSGAEPQERQEVDSAISKKISFLSTEWRDCGSSLSRRNNGEQPGGGVPIHIRSRRVSPLHSSELQQTRGVSAEDFVFVRGENWQAAQ